jgi:hypothetical protein
MIVNGELEKCLRNKSWHNLRYNPDACLEKLRKTKENMSNIVGFPEEIRTGCLPNASQ